MKSKIKRHSRSALAVILTLSMLVSCMMVGLIATDAARVTDSGTVGATLDDDSVGTAPASGSTLIVKTGQLGTDSSKKYYAYFFGGSITSGNEVWVELTKITAGAWNGKYYCTVPAGSPGKVIITRNNSNGSGWENKESQSVDITLSGNYAWVADSGETEGKANGDCTSKAFKVLVKNGTNGTETSYDLTEDNGSGVFSVTTPAITAADTHLEVKNYNSSNNEWYGNDGVNYPLNDCVVGNSYTVTASVDIKNVSTTDWTGSTFSKTLVSSNSSYSLTGNIDSTYIASINGVANTLDSGSSSEADWWKAYHSEAAINTAESGANVYSITFTTVDAATLATNGHSTIDIGLSIKGNKQKAFQIDGTYYNYIGGDYKVTSAGVTNQNIVDVAAKNGGGSLIIQPGRTYKLTVDETNNTFSIECTSGDKYFLAGQYAADGTAQFFGETWNTSNNELIYNSSTNKYELEFTENIPAGTISFKTVKNGDSDGWNGGSYPDQNNQSYKINANATKVKFSFDATNNTMTVTQENSGGGEGGTWPPTDTAVTNVTDSSTTTSKYLLVSNNDQFVTNGSNTMTAVALSNKYETSSNTFYWADLTDYLSYDNLHIILSTGSSKNDAANLGSDSKVNDKDFILKDSNNNYLSRDNYDYYDGSTKLFHAEGKDNNAGDDYFHRVEINQKHSSLNHLGVLIRTAKNSPSSNWIEYSFFYTDYVPPVVETKVVDIYAKNGTLRDSNYNRFTNLANTEILDYFYYEETNATTGEVTTYTSINGTGGYNAAHSGKEITIEHDKSYGNSHYDKMTNVPVGAKIKISTELSPNGEEFTSGNKFSDTHYLKAYSFNGMTYQVFKPSDAVATTKGEKYTEEWTVRAVNTTYKDSNGVLQNATTDGKTIEVTPIYYMKDNSNCKTFYIDGYDGEVQNAWGNLLCVYPYYEGIKEKGNAFGGYPGQPMLFWGGKYQMEIPLTVDGTSSGASVKGLTLHNSFWDLFHRSKDIRCNARNHAQTYDYDDFYKLYKEKNPDTIIFDYKYRTKHDNYGDDYQYTKYDFADNTTAAASKYAASNYNGVEVVTDYFGRQVDVFGNLLTDSQKSDYDTTKTQDKELLIVSTGYKDTYVGEYATLWAVYAPQSDIPAAAATAGDTAGKFIGLISSSELYLNTWDNASRYPVSDHGLLMTESRFENTYKHLKKYYTGVPALITYEKEIWNKSKDKANRSDGKWYYSNKNDKVSASIKIQYGSHTLMDAPDHSVSSDAWHDDPFDNSQTGVGGGNNIGTNTGCSAYFTNTTPNLLGKVASGEQFADSTKSFTFQAVPSGSYMFAGWVRYSNGKYYEISEKEVAESPMSANDVYIARFVDAQVGSLTIQHVVEKTDEFNGTGTPRIQVAVKNNGTTVTGGSFDVSDGSKIDISKWINSNFKDYTIDISLTTTPTGESFMKELVSSSGNFAASPSTWNTSYNKTNSSGADTNAQSATVTQFKVKDVLDSGVTSLRYVSHLMSPEYTYNYEITYTYYSRFWGQQSYTQTGTCEEGDFTGAKDTATLTTDFIINKTPYEKTFREQINWNYTTSTVEAGDYDAAPMVNNAAGTAASANTYKMTAHVYASKEVNDRVTAEFILPYKYNEKAQGYTVKDTDVYNSSGTKSGTSYLYDSGNESVTLSTKAYSLFTYDDENHTGSDDIQASSLPLMEAAPYLMTNLGDNDYHYKLTDNIRYYTGNSFKVGDTTYYKSQDDVPADATNYQVLTASDSVNFTKIKYAGTDKTTTYHFAVEDTSGGAKGEYGYKIYFFSYITDDFGNYVDNNGNPSDTPVFNGQYCVYSVGREKDGIIEGKGSKKYFTRWDIYNTKGDFVASCYNRRFNYSGYDNYVIKPVYDSDTEQNYASSAGLDNTTLANITYLGDTRNQWNNGDKGDYATVTGKTDGNTAGDKLIHDFALAYAYNGLEISKVSSSTPIKVGMIIEQLDPLDSAGGTKIVDSSYYAEKYNKSSNDHRPEVDMPKIKNWLEGKAGEGVKLSTYVGHTCINSKIGNNVDDNWGQKFGSIPAANSPTNIMSFDSVIDNFNRLQWFYTFTNTKTGEGGTIGATNNANYAYRAWAYIIVNETATVSSTPVYFTLYDSASR